jgi:hypothetical protein
MSLESLVCGLLISIIYLMDFLYFQWGLKSRPCCEILYIRCTQVQIQSNYQVQIQSNLGTTDYTPISDKFYFLQRIISVADEYNLGLDVRTAAYIVSLEKIFGTYVDAGLTF